MSKQILGLAYHSPLIIQMLPPPQLYQTALLLTDSAKDVKGEMDLALKKQGKRQLVILAGSLETAQALFRLYPDLTGFKLVLFDFPGLVQPAHITMSPLVQWLDCDHQAGGAWQTKKMKPEAFAQSLEKIHTLGPEGKDLIVSMGRFVPRDRLNAIESIQEYLPENYKEMIASDPGEEEEQQDQQDEVASFGLKTIIDYYTESFVEEAKRDVAIQVVDYLLKRTSKREFNAVLSTISKEDKELKKRSLLLKRWLDHTDLGIKLFWTYLDYIVNYPARSWETILKDGYNKDPDDLLILLARQPKTAQHPKGYANEIKKVSKLARLERVGDSIHPEPLPWNEIFKT